MRPTRLLCIAMAAGALAVPAAASAAGPPPACPPFDLDQSTQLDPACTDLPHFKASFLTRVWSFNGDADAVNVSARTLSFTIRELDDLPSRFRSQDDPLLDQDAFALLPADVRIYDEDGRRVGIDALADAEEVSVRGRLIRPSRWRADEDGDPVPTVRAKRVYVTDDGVEDPSYDEDDDHPVSQPPCVCVPVART